jgi:hypothetical protein
MVTTIDPMYSIFFDVYSATVTGTTVEFPVYINSDDPINSLDFAFKFNSAQFEYDTIINLTGYIEMLSNFNINDSTVYFTSYSFTQTYTNNTPLVVVRFNILSGTFCSDDLNSVISLLNGDLSSYRIIECQSSGINDLSNLTEVNIFPNPSSELVEIRSAEKVRYELYSTAGSSVIRSENTLMNDHRMNVSDLPAGAYMLKLYNDDATAFRKMIITH